MTSPVTLDLLTFDVGLTAATPTDYAEAVLARVEASWNEGADIVLLPEFTWMGLEPVIPNASLEAVATVFWETLYPSLSARLLRPGKTAVVGTVPFWDTEKQCLYNRGLIFTDGRALFQDKLHLTPWESRFTPGDALQVWGSHGLRMAVIICLDIEIPELSARLRGAKVDLILCPSATETILGVERVDRCASARAVELGCYVGVCHLVGNCSGSSLIDENVGRVAIYAPSQVPFSRADRWTESDVYTAGNHCLRTTVDGKALQRMRRRVEETNPSLLGRELAGMERLIEVRSV